MTDSATKPISPTQTSAAAPIASKAKTVPVTVKPKATLASAAPAVKAAKPLKPAKAPITKKPVATPMPAAVAKKKIVAKPAKPAVAVKPTKIKKPKMVRDSMTMPKAEYAVLDELKQRAVKLASPVKKTELLRAGIKALAAMSDLNFLAALKAVPSLKTGRPRKS